MTQEIDAVSLDSNGRPWKVEVVVFTSPWLCTELGGQAAGSAHYHQDSHLSL